MNNIIKSICLFILLHFSNSGIAQYDLLDPDTILPKLNGLSNIEKFDIFMQTADSLILGSLPKALEYGIQAEAISSEIDDPKRQISAKWLLADIYVDIGQLAKSMEYYFQIEVLAERYDLPSLIQINEEMGENYSLLGDREKAVHYIDKALTMAVDQNDSAQIASIYFTKGIVHANFEEYEQALTSYQKALKLSDIADMNECNVSQLYSEIAIIQTELGNYNILDEYTEKAIESCRNSNDKERESWIQADLGIMYKNAKNYDKAVRHLKNALTIFEPISPYIACNVYEALTECFEKKEMMDSAYYYTSLYQNLNDSLFSVKMYNEMAALSIQHADEKYRIQLKQEKKEKNGFIIGMFSLAIFSFSLIYLNVRNQKLSREVRKKEKIILTQEKKRVEERNKLLQTDLQHRHQQLTSRTLELARYRDSLDHIINTLNEIYQSNPANSTKQIEKLIFKIRQEFGVHSWWNEFSKWFSEIYIDFFKKCKTKAPLLTPQEKKICAFIKLNMRNKEIAGLMQLQVKSVEMYRMNIRKKFGLIRQDNLSQIISSL
jgi:tetratricopeptide (TPR) repeat protein/DNA-binding CsgD family transcriptional regulator